MNNNEGLRCIASPMLLTSIPPQFKCGTCGKTWSAGEESPICGVDAPKPKHRVFMPEDPADANLCDSCQ